MNAGIYNERAQENTVPTWLLPCTCGTQRCHCNAMFKPDILCVIGHPYDHPTKRPYNRHHHTIHKIYICNDIFVVETLDRKITKYQPLINNIITKGWNVAPLTILVACARATTHIPSMKKLETKFKLPLIKEI